MGKVLNRAVLGVGVIANEAAQALQRTDRKLYAVGNRLMKKPSPSPKNIKSKKFTKILTKCFLMKMLI